MLIKMSLYVDGVGYASAMLESEMGWTVDEAHCSAVGVFVGHKVEAIPPFPEVRFVIILFSPFLYCIL